MPHDRSSETLFLTLKDLGCAAASYHDSHVRNVRVLRVQCDEIRAFVGAKAKNTTPDKVEQGRRACGRGRR